MLLLLLESKDDAWAVCLHSLMLSFSADSV